MLVRQKVKDYQKWKPFFDEHAPTRKANGSKGGHLFRSADNPNEIIVLFEWDDVKNARKLAQSEDLRKTMEKAGVADKPDIYFLEEIEEVEVCVTSRCNCVGGFPLPFLTPYFDLFSLRLYLFNEEHLAQRGEGDFSLSSSVPCGLCESQIYESSRVLRSVDMIA